MPRRRSSGSFGGSRSSSYPSRSTIARQAPMRNPQASQPLTQQQTKPGIFSGLGQTMAQGAAFGAGSEVAHSTVRGLFGGHSARDFDQSQPYEQQQLQQQQEQTQPCYNEMTTFSNCLKRETDISQCQSYMDMLKQCQKKYDV